MLDLDDSDENQGDAVRDAVSASADDAVFEALARAYRLRVLAYCRGILGDVQEAEDAVQETFVRVWRSRAWLDGDGPAWPWLQTIARNLCLDELRRRKRRRLVQDGASPPDVVSLDFAEESESRIDEGRVLAGAFAGLLPRQRRLLFLQACEELSYEELAAVEGSTPTSVAKALVRARARARKFIEETHAWLGGLPPIAWVLRSGRKLRSRMASGPAVQAAAGVSLGEVVAIVGIGIAMMVGGFEGERSQQPGPQRTRGRDAGIEIPWADPRRAEVPSGARPSAMRIELEAEGLIAEVESVPPRDDAALPEENRSRVEIHDGDGRLLFWYEGEFRCGGQGGQLLPSAGPVHVVC